MLNPIQRILILCVVSFSGVHAPAESLTFRSDYYCPYVCDPQSTSPGYMVEILQNIFTKEGIPVEVKITNWVRAIKDTRHNNAQGLIGTSRGDAPDLIYPLKPLGVMKPAFFTYKDSLWSYDGRHSIVNSRIGVINGYWYGEDLDRLLRARHSSFVPFSGEHPLEQILKMSQTKRLDAFIENIVVLNYALEKNKIPATEFKHVGWVTTSDPYLYIAFSAKNPKSHVYTRLLDKGIEELRRSGHLRRILNKYNVEDWEAESNLSMGSLNNFSPSIFKSPLNLLNVLDARSL